MCLRAWWFRRCVWFVIYALILFGLIVVEVVFGWLFGSFDCLLLLLMEFGWNVYGCLWLFADCLLCDCVFGLFGLWFRGCGLRWLPCFSVWLLIVCFCFVWFGFSFDLLIGLLVVSLVWVSLCGFVLTLLLVCVCGVYVCLCIYLF